MGNFKGNTIVKIDFSRLADSNNPTIIFGKSRELGNISVEVFDFSDLEENQIPNSTSEGRGRFIDKSRIFIEETNLGRAFVYNLKTKKLEWTYINKGKRWIHKIFRLVKIFKKYP